MNAENKVPAIRFKGFSGAWVEKKLKDLTETGFSNGVFNDPQKVGKGYRLINVKDMYLGSSIDIDSLSLVDIDEKEFKNNKVEYGDIFFTRSSLVKEGIAYSNVNLSNHKGLTFDGHLIKMQPCKKSTNPVFLASLFKTSFARNQFIFGGKTTTMTTIGQSDIASVEVAIPSVEEQTKIGNYFQRLDTLIAQHQQKHDKLLNIKKALLERMFPKQGATVPEIRFKGFSGQWEEKHLNELCTLITKQTGFDYSATIKPSLVRKNDITTYSFIQNKDFNGSSVNLETDFFIPKIIAEEFPRILINVPSILISISGKIGNVGFYQLPVKSFVGGAVGICKLIDNSDGLLIMHQLLSNKGQTYFKSLTKSSSHSNITVEDIREIKAKIPTTKEEKDKIGNFFKQIDTLLNQHQTQLKKLNNIKQACLEKMFV